MNQNLKYKKIIRKVHTDLPNILYYYYYHYRTKNATIERVAIPWALRIKLTKVACCRIVSHINKFRSNRIKFLNYFVLIYNHIWEIRISTAINFDKPQTFLLITSDGLN